jgi:Bestrophin, RFP-TM, chloride channel
MTAGGGSEFIVVPVQTTAVQLSDEEYQSRYRVSRSMSRAKSNSDVPFKAPGDQENNTRVDSCETAACSLLVKALRENQAVRTAAFEDDGRYQIQYAKSTDGWLATIFVGRGRELQYIRFPFCVVVLHGIAYTCIAQLVVHSEEDKPPASTSRLLRSWEFVFGIVLNSTLSLLLVFRLNRAANRYWDARTMWGILVARVRTLVSGILLQAEMEFHDNSNRAASTTTSHCFYHRDEAIRWICGTYLF